MHDISEPRRSNIDDWCDRFEAEWKSGARPKLPEYIQQWKGTGRAELFRYLLELDVDYRRRAGTETSAADYRKQFPEFESIIAEVLERDVGTVSLRQGKTRPPSTPATDAPPQTIGDYEILSALGQGGMGVVYKARQRSLNRLVALKMIRSGDFANRDELERFQAEAEAAASLSHPAIVPVYEVGNEQGRLYFSMELVEGGSLADRIAETPLSPSVAARLIEQVARAIAYAHEKGVIHRDLKPANILLDSHGSPRIMDFGLAKRLDVDRELTATGQILGTPNYMPPEQASGDLAAISPRSDIYSLGAVLYRLIAGRPPFQAATLADTLYEVQKSDPQPPSNSARGIPRDLDTICLKCLEKSPSQRYTTALELADELGRFLRNEPIRARPLSPIGRFARWSQRNPLVASLATLFVATLLTGTIVSTYFGYSATLNAAAARDAATDANAKLLEANAARTAEQVALRKADKELREANAARAEKQIALSNAESEAYFANIALSHRNWLDRRPGAARERLAATNQRLRGWEFGLLESNFQQHQTRLRHPEGFVRSACFVQESQQVLTGTQGVLRLWDLKTQLPIKTIKLPEDTPIIAIADAAALSAWAVVTSAGKLFIIDPRTGSTNAEHVLDSQGLEGAVFSRDGRLLLANAKEYSQLYLWDVIAGKALAEPETDGLLPHRIDISPGGQRYSVLDLHKRRLGIGAVSQESKLVWQADSPDKVNIINLKFIGDSGPLLECGGLSSRLYDETSQKITPLNHGASLPFAANDSVVVWTRNNGLRFSFASPNLIHNDFHYEMIGSEGEFYSLYLSSDARRVLSVGSNHAGNPDTIVWDLEQFKLSNARYSVRTYDWLFAINPDHSRVVLKSPDPSKNQEIRIIDTATGLVIRTVNLGTAPRQAEFSADGAWLALTTVKPEFMAGGGYLKVSDGELRPLPNSDSRNVHAIRVSAEGKYLAVSEDTVNNLSRLCIWRLKDQSLLLELGGDSTKAFAFSNRGDQLAYLDGPDVVVRELHHNKIVRRFAQPKGQRSINFLQFSPSDRQLAGGDFGTGYVWRLDGELQDVQLRGHFGQLRKATFTQDETRILTYAEGDDAIKLWELPGGREVLSFPANGLCIELSLSNDDGRLVTATIDNDIVVRQQLASPKQSRLKLPPP